MEQCTKQVPVLLRTAQGLDKGTPRPRLQVAPGLSHRRAPNAQVFTASLAAEAERAWLCQVVPGLRAGKIHVVQVPPGVAGSGRLWSLPAQQWPPPDAESSATDATSAEANAGPVRPRRR